MLWLWLIVTVILFAVSMFALGYIDDVDKVGLFWCAFLGSLFWPIVLTAVLIFGPFVGFYWLGDRKRKQRLEKKESADNK